MRKIAVFTGTRAEYGLLYWLLKDIQINPSLELQLLVSAMHLSPEFGMTYQQIEADGFVITENLDEVDCVVMGFDTELTFKKLEDVSKLLLTRENLPYIATNPDWVCPTWYGSVPDCGSVCDMIYNATKKRPLVIGKPEALMPQLAMEKLGIGKEQTCVVGDRIYTDVKSGLNAGITGILVLSGETTPEILAESPDKPHLVLPDAGEILKALKR